MLSAHTSNLLGQKKQCRTKTPYVHWEKERQPLFLR